MASEGLSARLSIGGGAIKDMWEAYGFLQNLSDTRFSAPLKSFATVSYAEEEGEHLYPYTTDDAFDYKITFFIKARNFNLDNVNRKIAAFNRLLYSVDSDGVKQFQEVTLYNDYKRAKIVGIPQPLEEADDDDFFRRKGVTYDWVLSEWTIRVTTPSLCDFEMEDVE